MASLFNKVNIVCELINLNNIDVNQAYRFGDTALLLVTKKSDNWDVVRELITHKNVDLNVRGRFGYTVLMWATLKESWTLSRHC
jgi:ankyrin repeat protein